MTIRDTLLGSFVLISLASAMLITLMIFIHFGGLLSVDIEKKLNSEAMSVMQQIDTTLFERIENLVIWSQLDVMQELRFRDVDKRLADFLSRLHKGYDGVYQQLYATDQNNQILSTSDPNLLGTYQPKISIWLEASYKDNNLSFLPLTTTHDRLYFSIAIPNAFQSGQLGRLYAVFDWKEISTLLETHLPFSSIMGTSYAVLVDAEGRVIAKSSKLSDHAPELSQVPKEWTDNESRSEVLYARADFMGNQKVLIACAPSHGYRGFKGLGWRVLIIQPANIAFAPIWALWKTFAIFSILTLILSILASLWISQNIAKPIASLAEFTRDFMAGRQQVPPPLKASREITELSFQFSKMINSLEQSRLDTVRAAKLAMIGEMAASMAHEVRTPLGIIQSSAQILQRETGLTEVGYEMTEFIISETKRLNGLVTTLLECSQSRPPRFLLEDIHQVIEYTIDLVANQLDEKTLVVTHFDDAQSLIYCDRDQMIQVFLNLIMNASQHALEGEGRIELNTFTEKDGYLGVQVCDNGKGISEIDKNRVFEPFFTQRKSGIGLGLTVVQQIILAHNGKIFITDSSSGGACFNLILPLMNSQEKVNSHG